MPEFGERFQVLPLGEMPGVLPGMTHQEVRDVYNALRDDPSDTELARFLQKLRLDDTQPDFLYFWVGECPLLRYRFNNNLLVAVGAVQMELGVWHYSNWNYLEFGVKPVSIRTKDGLRRFRVDPKYDERGNLIKIELIEQELKRR
jgi:hypothetical protein